MIAVVVSLAVVMRSSELELTTLQRGFLVMLGLVGGWANAAAWIAGNRSESKNTQVIQDKGGIPPHVTIEVTGKVELGKVDVNVTGTGQTQNQNSGQHQAIDPAIQSGTSIPDWEAHGSGAHPATSSDFFADTGEVTNFGDEEETEGSKDNG